MTRFEELRKRKLVQWGIAYLAGGWILLQVIAYLDDTFQWPTAVRQALTILVAAGFVATLIVAWYHGEQERQRVSALEIVMLAALLATAGTAIALVRDGGEEAPAAATPEAVPEVDRASIAALPFENMSGDADARPFIDGLHDDLLTQLVKIGGLKVISRTSVEAYRDSPLTLERIAAELGVATVLEGGVQRAGDRVRVNVQLIDAATDAHLWAESYDRELTATNLFDIQREIATEIARTLRARLTAAESERLAEIPTENLEAYDRYLRGRSFYQRSLVLSDVRSAAEAFESAVEADPEFAEAWAMLSIARSTLSWQFGINEEREPAESAARKALELAPDSPLALTAMGYERYYGHREYDAALEWLRRAEGISPNDPDVLAPIGWVLRRKGELREALGYLRRAYERNPRSLDIVESTGMTAVYLGEFDEAERFFELAATIDPGYPWIYVKLAELALQRSGDVEGALAAVERGGERVEPARIVFPSPVLSRVLASRLGERLKSASLGPRDGSKGAPFVYSDLTALTLHLGKGFVYRETGPPAAARAQFDSVIALVGTIDRSELDAVRSDQGYIYGSLGMAQAATGRASDALRSGRRAAAWMEDRVDHWSGPQRRAELTTIYVMLGERERALDELERLLTEPYLWTPALVRADPLWEPFRDDPRFRRLTSPRDR